MFNIVAETLRLGDSSITVRFYNLNTLAFGVISAVDSKFPTTISADGLVLTVEPIGAAPENQAQTLTYTVTVEGVEVNLPVYNLSKYERQQFALNDPGLYYPEKLYVDDEENPKNFENYALKETMQTAVIPENIPITDYFHSNYYEYCATNLIGIGIQGILEADFTGIAEFWVEQKVPTSAASLLEETDAEIYTTSSMLGYVTYIGTETPASEYEGNTLETFSVADKPSDTFPAEVFPDQPLTKLNWLTGGSTTRDAAPANNNYQNTKGAVLLNVEYEVLRILDSTTSISYAMILDMPQIRQVARPEGGLSTTVLRVLGSTLSVDSAAILDMPQRAITTSAGNAVYGFALVLANAATQPPRKILETDRFKFRYGAKKINYNTAKYAAYRTVYGRKSDLVPIDWNTLQGMPATIEGIFVKEQVDFTEMGSTFTLPYLKNFPLIKPDIINALSNQNKNIDHLWLQIEDIS